MMINLQTKLYHSINVINYIWSHPANGDCKILRLANAIKWQINKRVKGKYWDLKIFNNMYLRCYSDSASAGGVIYTNGLFDYHEMSFIQHYLRPNDHFLDIGANIGVYTLLAASIVGRLGSIDTFEPSPKVLSRLQENVDINNLDNVNIHPVAVGSSSGSVYFSQYQEDSLNHIQTTPTNNVTSVEVPCVSLDNVLFGKRYAMAKIDIEGAEPLAFQGAKNMLSEQNPPVWLLEINAPQLRFFGFSEQQLSDLLANYGYDLAWYNANSRQLLWDSQPWKEHKHNVFAIARSARDEVMSRVIDR